MSLLLSDSRRGPTASRTSKFIGCWIYTHIPQKAWFHYKKLFAILWKLIGLINIFSSTVVLCVNETKTWERFKWSKLDFGVNLLSFSYSWIHPDPDKVSLHPCSESVLVVVTYCIIFSCFNAAWHQCHVSSTTAKIEGVKGKRFKTTTTRVRNAYPSFCCYLNIKTWRKLGLPLGYLAAYDEFLE